MAGQRVYGPKLRRAWRSSAGAVAICGLLSALAASPACAQKVAASSSAGPAHAGLSEEQVFLEIRHSGGTYRLEAVVAKKAGATGKLPIALLTHGKPRLPAEMAEIRSELLLRQARDLAHRGWLAVLSLSVGRG